MHIDSNENASEQGKTSYERLARFVARRSVELVAFASMVVAAGCATNPNDERPASTTAARDSAGVESQKDATAAEGETSMFREPYIDKDEWRETPVRHRYVHGGFKNTDLKFVLYFPPKEKYQGRFFQYIAPIPVSEDQVLQGFGSEGVFKGQGVAGFAFASGGYAVGSNQGGKSATATPDGKADPSIAGYRASAAVARSSRIIAAEMYGAHRTYGYAFGGSGGAFRTIGCAENTTAWDGVVAYVMGTPMAIPNVFTVRINATRLLRNKLRQIADAVAPGGSGDMDAGLSEEERAALAEATKMGLPTRAWEFAEYFGLGSFEYLFAQVRLNDPTYFTDFWTVPGYLGADAPPSLIADRVRQVSKVKRVVMSDQAASAGVPSPLGPAGPDAANAWRLLERQKGGVFPVALELENAPRGGDLRMADIKVMSGAASGATLSLGSMKGDFAILASNPFVPNPANATAIQPGDEVKIDNSDFLSAQTYHRHQVPSRDYHSWDQFRKPDGTPKYPQRATLMGPGFNMSASGMLPTGRFNGKMIVVESMLDWDAYPWSADWYRKKVEANYGKQAADKYRLWYVDNAVHGDLPGALFELRFAPYNPVVHQALRDLSAWAERDVKPPETSRYKVVDGQVVLPPTGELRKGVQPVVTARANGGTRANVAIGEPVNFAATIDLPPGGGELVDAAWDFDGSGAFLAKASVTKSKTRKVTVETTYTFAKAGTYFPVLRATSMRHGDAQSSYARLQNIGRVRVVVR